MTDRQELEQQQTSIRALTDRAVDRHQQAIADMEIALANLAWALENRKRLLAAGLGEDFMQ